MIKGVVLVAVLIVVGMVALKDGRILRTAGLTGTCSVVQANTGLSEVVACKAGRLEGRPDLSRRGCKSVGLAGSVESWRCPVGFDVSDLGR